MFDWHVGQLEEELDKLLFEKIMCGIILEQWEQILKDDGANHESEIWVEVWVI